MCLFVGLFRGRSLSKGSMNMKELHLCQPNSDPRTVILVLSSCLWPSNCLLINLSRCFFVRAALTQQLSFFDPAAASLKIKIHFLGNFVSRIRPECWQVKSLAEIHKCCWVLKYRDRIYIWPKRSAASKDTKSVKTVKRFGQCDAQATVDQRCLPPPAVLCSDFTYLSGETPTKTSHHTNGPTGKAIREEKDTREQEIWFFHKMNPHSCRSCPTCIFQSKWKVVHEMKCLFWSF